MNLPAKRIVLLKRGDLVTRRLRPSVTLFGSIFFLSFAATLPTAAATPTEVQALKQLSLEELLDLEVISVSRRPEKFSETASALQVILGEDIRRSGATSIPEALRLADNLHVAQKGSHAWSISARGFNTDSANKLLVLRDGRTVYTPLFSGVFWDVQDYLLEDIDRIEVISGPGGTLWGANAVNGVINIISKSAKDTQGSYAEVGGGSEMRGFVGARYGGTLSSNVFFRVYGKFFDRDDSVLPTGKDAHDAWRFGQTGFRIDAEPSTMNLLTLQGDFYGGDEDVSTGGDSKVAGGNLLGRWTHTFSEESEFILQMYYDRTHLNAYIVSNDFAPDGYLTDDLDTFDIDFQHRFPLGERQKVTWGLGYRFTHDEVENAPALAFFPTTLNQHLFSGFLQDEMTLWPERLRFTIGSKVEYNDYTGFEYEPSARLAWTVTERQTVWGAVSRAVRMPSRVDRDSRLPIPFFPVIDNLLIGGPTFESETVIAYELGHRAQISDRWSSSISLFYNDYGDVRSTSLSPPDPILGLPFPLFYANNLEGHSYGVELSTYFQLLPWWRLQGGYTYLRTDLRVKPGMFDFNNALNETADPKHQFSLRSIMDLGENVEFDARLRWVDSFQYNVSGVPDTVPSYFELDVRLAWRPTENVELAVVGQNLLHDQHLEYVVANPNPRVEVERAVYARITLRW